MNSIYPTLWFRVLRCTYPWTALILMSGRIVCAGDRAAREQVRLMVTLLKLDWAMLMALAIDLLVPEAWV